MVLQAAMSTSLPVVPRVTKSAKKLKVESRNAQLVKVAGEASVKGGASKGNKDKKEVRKANEQATKLALRRSEDLVLREYRDDADGLEWIMEESNM
jgi:hypothetical protein